MTDPVIDNDRLERVARAIEDECGGCDPGNFSAFVDAARAAIAAAETPEPELPSNFVKPEWWDAFWQSAARQINPQRPHGCICPPGAEATCQGWMCPRRAIGAPI